jgi:hypothetical protein
VHSIACTEKAVVRRRIDGAYNVSEQDTTSVFRAEVNMEAAGSLDTLVAS